MNTRTSRSNILSLRGWRLCGLALWLGVIQFAAVVAQDTSTVTIDNLLAPVSPAFTVMGVEPTSVERPGNLTDFSVTMLNATQDLTRLPRDFAVEFPLSIFKRGASPDIEQTLAARSIGKDFWKLLSFSLATAKETEFSEDTASTVIGAGLRFSWISGGISGDLPESERQARIDSQLQAYGTVLHKRLAELKKSDSIYQHLEALSEPIRDDATISPKAKQSSLDLIASLMTEREAELKEAPSIRSVLEHLSESIRVRRFGFKLDVAFGVAGLFADDNWSHSKLARIGGWVTPGFEWEKGWSLLGVFRYLGSPDKTRSTFDSGIRLVLDDKKKFSLSAEGVARMYAESSQKDTWRLAMIADYNVAKNKNLSFTFGRDFEGRQNGNLISMLNLIMGFGGKVRT